MARRISGLAACVCVLGGTYAYSCADGYSYADGYSDADAYSCAHANGNTDSNSDADRHAQPSKWRCQSGGIYSG